MQDYISTIARPQELANASNEEKNVYDINDYRADYKEEHPAVYVGTPNPQSPIPNPQSPIPNPQSPFYWLII